LFLGTPRDNALDARNKGRLAPQRSAPYPKHRHPKPRKIDEDIVLDIRARYPKETLQKLADAYTIDQSYVSLIVNRKVFTDI
jgi:hypothetical protein